MSKNTIIAGGQAEKKILILRSSANIFDHTDYKSFKPAMGENVGNKLWLMGLYSCVSGTNCSVDFYDRKMDPGYINENYDMCIKPEANIFGEHFAHWMDYHVKQYKNIRIPIHVIAAGAQAKSYDDLDALAERIKPSAVNFIESIEKTGGTFALRGRFTEALLKKYGYHKAYVTGCPSLFQLGIIQIDHAVSDSRELLTAFNGNLKLCCDYLLKKNANGCFFDQSVFFDSICGDSWNSNYSALLKKYGLYGARLLYNKKVRLFIDMPDWMCYLRNNAFNFSFGTRIHGNIMSVLSGIPALVVPPDARVNEMCEFFDIPTVSYSQVKNKEMIDLYNIADYSRFNDGFKNKLQYYIDYLHTIGIEYNKSNVFFDNVLNNRYTINEGYDKYFSVVSSMKRDKANECYYILKELGKTILRKNGI